MYTFCKGLVFGGFGGSQGYCKACSFQDPLDGAFRGSLLGGSWVVISRVISRVPIVIAYVITPLITTQEPPSRMFRGVLESSAF